MTTETQTKPTIYAFCNGGEPGWLNMAALSEDGVFLAGHVCSSTVYGPHDMGVTGDWKHEIYRKYYPDGFEVVWVEADDPRLRAAYKRHKAHTKEEYAAKLEPIKDESRTPSVVVEFSEAEPA